MNLCIKPALTFTLGLHLQLTCYTQILSAQNPAVVPVYNSIDMEHRLFQEVHLADEIG
jgi:hypothetical protein